MKVAEVGTCVLELWSRTSHEAPTPKIPKSWIAQVKERPTSFKEVGGSNLSVTSPLNLSRFG